MAVLSCDDAAGRWHRCWHRNVIGAIAECVLMDALAVPLIGVTSVLGGSGPIGSLFLVFKTGVSSGPAQAGSIPVRLRYQGLSSPLASFARQFPCFPAQTMAQSSAEHLELAIANIQRLTLDNHHLRQQLHAATKITHINARSLG
jgi:hypothetical protein